MEDELFRMIEHDIELLLDDSNEDELIIESSYSGGQFKHEFENNMPHSYTNAESAANEGLLLGQYVKWSTVESDELNVPNQLFEQRNENRFLPLLSCFVVQNFVNPFGSTKRVCAFCKKNGMHFAIYSSHTLRVNGIQTCPFLLQYRCTNCNQNGHTISHCPSKRNPTPNCRITRTTTPMIFNRSNADQVKRI